MSDTQLQNVNCKNAFKTLKVNSLLNVRQKYIELKYLNIM